MKLVCKMGWTGAINVKVHATMSCPNFLQRMQLMHPHWNLKSCFVLFCSVWVHLGPFRWFTILGSNHAELLQLKQKFKPQSCNRILCNKSTNPRHLILNSCYGSFHSVWEHLGAFCCDSKLGAKLAELVQLIQKFVPQSRVWCFHNERTQSTPLDPRLIFCCLS